MLQVVVDVGVGLPVAIQDGRKDRDRAGIADDMGGGDHQLTGRIDEGAGAELHFTAMLPLVDDQGDAGDDPAAKVLLTHRPMADSGSAAQSQQGDEAQDPSSGRHGAYKLHKGLLI